MLRGERVTLRAVAREDLDRLAGFANDLEVELAGRGDPPVPRPFERIVKDFEREVSEPPRDKTHFAIEADGECIGTCGLFNIDLTARHAELGIGIGDKEYWGRGYGRESVGLLLDYAFRLRNLPSFSIFSGRLSAAWLMAVPPRLCPTSTTGSDRASSASTTRSV